MGPDIITSKLVDLAERLAMIERHRFVPPGD